MSKQILNLQAAPQPLKAGQKQIVKIAKGQHVRVQDLLEGAAKDASNVVVTKQAKDLKLKFADGTELQFENFYEECAGNACSITLAGKDATGYAINGDSAVGAATQDGSQLVYAYGDQTSLMAMANGDTGLSSVLGASGEGTMFYIPAAAQAAGGSGLLGLLGGGLGLAAAAGAGGGGAAAAITGIVPEVLPAVLRGVVMMGPVVAGHDLTVTVFKADGGFLTSGKVNSDGTFSIAIEGYRGAVLVRVSDANNTVPDYIDETTRQPKDLTVDLRAATMILAPGTYNVAINMLTELAVREMGLPGGTAGSAAVALNTVSTDASQLAAVINTANTDVAEAFGLAGQDLVRGTLPVPVINLDGSTNTNANDYGKVLAGLSGAEKNSTTEAVLKAFSENLTGNVLSAEAIKVLVDGSVNAGVTITAATANLINGLQVLIADLQAQITSKIADLQAQITSNDGDIALLIDDTNAVGNESGKPTTASLAGLKAALEGLDAAGSEAFTALEEAIGVPADAKATPAVAATGLYKAIDDAVSAAVTKLEGQIADLQAQITSNDGDIALLIDDTNAVGNESGKPTTASLAGLKAALEALSSTSGADVTALLSAVGAPTVYDADGKTVKTAATGLYALIADLQSQIDDIVKPDLIQANELDNRIELYSYDGKSTFIRAELYEGNDYINSFSGTEEIVGGAGADTINLTYKDTSNDKVIYQSIYDGKALPVVTVDFPAVDGEGDFDYYRAGTVLSIRVNNTAVSYSVTEGLTAQDAVAGLATAIENHKDLGAITATAEGNTLRIVGVDGMRLNVQPLKLDGYEISNPGLASQVVLTFSDDPADYPQGKSLGGTFVFDREITVTINGMPVTAAIAYDKNKQPDPAATMVNIKAAIEAQMLDEGDFVDVLASVSLDGMVLTLVGKTTPGEEPAVFTVDSVEVSNVGEQQQTTVSFSSNDADYYAGGTLSVTVAGQLIEADMVAGNAVASVQNLLQAVKEAEEGVTTGVFQFDHDLEATSVLNESASGHARYSITLKIGEVVYQKAALFDSVDEATTVAGVVDELNVAFAGVAVFTLDAANDRINVRTTAGNTIKAADGLNTATIFLAVDGQYDGSELPAPGESFVSSVNQVPPNPALEGLLETVAQSVAGAVESSQVEAGGDNSAWTYAIGEDGPFLLAEAGVAFGTLPGYQFTIDSNLPRIPGSYVRFDSVADFIASLKIDGTIDTAGLYPITEIYDLDFAGGTLTFSPKDGGPNIGMRPPYLNFGEEVLGTDLILTARDETSDPVSATVTMGYAGEAQTATLDLEDAAVYDAYTNGAATERGASVYFQGGKVYATIAPVDDPATGEVDESVVHAVTVSANMGTGRDPGYWATSSLIGSGSGYTLASVDTVVPWVFYLSLSYEEDAGTYDHPTTGWAGGGKTLGQIALDIAALDFVANAYYVENPSGGLSLVVEYEPVAGRTYASGQLVVDVGGVTQANGSLYIEAGSGNAEKTAENLVAAINAQTGEGGDLAGLIGSAASDSQTGKITLTAAAPGKETFAISDVRMDYQGVKQIATVDFSEINIYDGGDLSLTIQGVGDGALPITIIQEMLGDKAATIAALKAQIQAEIDGKNVTSPATPAVISDSDLNFYPERLLKYNAESPDYFNSSVLISLGGVEVVNFDYVHKPGDTLADLIAAINAAIKAQAGEGVTPDVRVELLVDPEDEARFLVVVTSENPDSELFVQIDYEFDGGGGVVIAQTKGTASPIPGSTEFVPGSLAGIVGEVVEENGVFTLVSADKVGQQFSITDATTDDPVGEAQVTTVSLNESAPNGTGTYTLTVEGEPFTGTDATELATAITTFLADQANSAANIVANVAKVEVVEGDLVITGKGREAGFPTFSVVTPTELVQTPDDTNSVHQEVTTTFSSGWLTSLTTDEVVTFVFGDEQKKVDVTITAEATTNAAKLALLTAALDGSTLSDATLIGNTITIRASGFAPNELGQVSFNVNGAYTGTFKVLRDGVELAGSAFAVDETLAGYTAPTNDTHEVAGDVFTSNAVQDDMDVLVTVVNPGSGIGGNPGFYGDAPLAGSEGEGGLTGQGVQQVYTNPEELNTLYGSNAGYYTEDGLYTSYLSGGTPVDGANDAQGNFFYSALDEITIDDEVNIGEAPSELDVTFASGEDGFTTTTRDGFAAYGFDVTAADIDTVTSGSAGPDVIWNFQVDEDLISLEGDLANSTFDGSLDLVDAGDTSVVPSITSISFGAYIGGADQAAGGAGTMLGVAWKFAHGDADQPFTITSGTTQQTLILMQTDHPPGKIEFELSFNNSTFDSVEDFMQQLNASKKLISGDPESALVQQAMQLSLTGSLADGFLSITAPTAPASSTLGLLDAAAATNFDARLNGLSVVMPAFDLSTDEFGLVQSMDSTLDAAQINDAALVATLLDSLFDFSGSANNELNTSIFAVTAQDDPSQTAIWAHRQSSNTDTTVEAVELYQLALVHTLPGLYDEFTLQNFGAMPMLPV